MVRRQHTTLIAITTFVWLGMRLATVAAVTNVHVTFTNDPITQITVSWRTGSSDTLSEVQYGTTAAYGQVATNGTLISSAGGLEHHVRLTGLQPGTVYHYRCGNGTEWSPDGTFRTAPTGNEPFLFAAPGDVQTSDYEWTQARLAAFLERMDPAFWIPLGDLVQYGNNQAHWDAFFSSMDSLARHSPVMPLIGNHESATGTPPYVYPQLYANVFELPANGDSANQDLYYAFEYGDALFVVVTNCFAWFSGCYDTQLAWMDSVLSRTTKAWRFVFLHVPIYHGTATNNFPEWNALWEANNVNAVFTGDAHVFEMSLPINNDTLAASYAEGTLYYTAPYLTQATVVAPDWWTRLTHNGIRGVWLTPVIEVMGDSAVVTTWDANNDSVFDRLVLPRRSATPVARPHSTHSTGDARLMPTVCRGGSKLSIWLPESRLYEVGIITLDGRRVARLRLNGGRKHVVDVGARGRLLLVSGLAHGTQTRAMLVR